MKPVSVVARVVKVLVVAWVVYLVLVNVLLYLPLTQTVASAIRPERFHVRWESAWSWYPFHVHAREVFAAGQSRSQQWQVEAEYAQGSIAILPLVLKRVYLSDLEVRDISYRQRPRLKADKSYGDRLPHFPDIEGYPVTDIDPAPLPDKKPWRIFIEGALARGQHYLHLYEISGTLEGSLRADMQVESRSGPFSMVARDIALELGPTHVNGVEELFHSGRITGSLDFLPIVFKENKSMQMFNYLQLDAELDLDLNNLDFINLFTANLGGLRVHGSGNVEGPLKLDRGTLLAGSNLQVNARELLLDAFDVNVRGHGTISLKSIREEPELMTLDIDYGGLEIAREAGEAAFVEGDSLFLQIRANNHFVPDTAFDLRNALYDESVRQKQANAQVILRLDEATMTDMTILNDYLLVNTPMIISSGTALVDAEVVARQHELEGYLTLDSANLGLRREEQDIVGNLDADIVLRGGDLMNLQFDIGGSSVRLFELGVVGDRVNFDDKKWSTNIVLQEATAGLQQPQVLHASATFSISDTRPIVALFVNHVDAPPWISQTLRFEDIEGTATIDRADNRLHIPRAQIGNDAIEVAVKGVFADSGPDTFIYARYRKLDALLKMSEGRKNVDIINVQQKFREYQPAL